MHKAINKIKLKNKYLCKRYTKKEILIFIKKENYPFLQHVVLYMALFCFKENDISL